ncbi:MAG: McrC family protein [Anaerovoracaceae bacterium]|jgi:5-methylcytosine-specific restriction enzyme subunit McrC
MDKLLEIREFDKISCNPDYQTEYAYLPENVFRDLQEFIHSFTGDGENADALEFLHIGYRRNVGDIISVSNYVGLIQMQNGWQIQILPKIDFAGQEDPGNAETKRVLLRMLRSMKDFPSKVFHDANLRLDRMPLYEIFINMYLQEARILVKHGLRSAYIRREDNLKYFKGKLQVNEQIRKNAAHCERFYVRYDEYQVDRPENRLIKSTLLKLQRLSSSAENQKEIRQLLAYFEMVTPSANYQRDFSGVVMDRSTKDYRELMRWSKVFLLDRSFTTFSGNTKARALLFPMEKVFESYVAQQLKKALADLDWDVSAQDSGYYLFDSPRRFALRPDLVITRDDGTSIILDTKWKSLMDNPRKNYGISQADMYQMYAYAKKYETSEVWLLYPLNQEMRDHPEISFDSEDGVNVKLFFVDVADVRESMKDLTKRLKQRAGRNKDINTLSEGVVRDNML